VNTDINLHRTALNATLAAALPSIIRMPSAARGPRRELAEMDRPRAASRPKG